MLGTVDAAAGARMGRERRQRRRDGRPTTLLGMMLAGDVDVTELLEALPADPAEPIDDALRARLGLRTDEVALLEADPRALRLIAFARRTHQALPEPPAAPAPGAVWNLARELDLLARFDDPFDVAALADWVEASGILSGDGAATGDGARERDGGAS